MAYHTKIRYINRSNRQNPHELITHIGGAFHDGSPWKISQESAIEGICNGKWEFYVQSGTQMIKVIVAESDQGNKYLKSESDGEIPNHLLNLPEFP